MDNIAALIEGSGELGAKARARRLPIVCARERQDWGGDVIRRMAINDLISSDLSSFNAGNSMNLDNMDFNSSTRE